MARSHHFHVDHGGHSITVNVRSGLATEAELLVDGKEVDHRRAHGPGPCVLTGELPTEPSRPFWVDLHVPRRRSGELRCVIKLDGIEQIMPERPTP